MPRLKADEFSFDEEELEGAEWSEDEYSSYDGPEPPARIVLRGFVKKMWITEARSSKNDMLVVLFEAKDNVGDRAQYDGWATWDHLVLQANTKFRWQPFLNATGLTLQDIKKKMYVGEDEENNGLPIEKIGTWVPGEQNDAAWLMAVTKREFYDGESRGKVAKYLEWEDPEEDEDEPESEPTPARKAPRGSTTSSNAKPATRRSKAAEPEEEPEDEEPEDEEPEEPEEEQESAPRGRRAAAKPATKAPAARTPASRSRQPAAARAPARGRGRAARGSTQDPPF
jgi:hypothetical protein